jgi:hypothetical protein
VIIPLNFWQENIANVPQGIEKKVLYAFGAYLVNKDDSLHLAPRKGTRWVVASGDRPRAKALLNAGLAGASKTDAGVTSLNKGGSNRDFTTCPAVPACIGDVAMSMTPKMQQDDVVFEVPGVLAAIEDPDRLLTQDGARIYARVSLSDFGASTTAVITEEAALALTNTKTKEQFLEQAAKGCLAFSRGHIRIHRAPTKDGVIKLTVVCAKPRIFEVPSVENVLFSDGRVVPVSISAISPSPTGKLSLSIAGTHVLAAGALAVVKATQEPDTVTRDDSYAIKNFVKDAIDGSPTIYSAVTTTILSRLNKYALAPDATALVHITSINDKELVVGDVWQLSGDDPDLTVFKQELEFVAKVLTAPPSNKRKATTVSELLPKPKRSHPTFDAPCVG